jgi:hypothetical protein
MMDSVGEDRARDARAEDRARTLLGSVAGAEVLASYEELGVVAVHGRGEYGYLLYPHRPIVAFDSRTSELLSELCVRFPCEQGGEAGERLPDADDVLAKWLALQADERGLISTANLDRPGRQLDPAMVRRDLELLLTWPPDGAPG